MPSGIASPVTYSLPLVAEQSQGFGKSMETKSWLWRRKPSEKTIIKEKALDLERSLKNLNEQLSSARNESDAKMIL
ncbi:hypothetical protein HPP92_026252 [Vanilla planifolia]|uniref:Uncharacterized protein n=1 Tax=Vanilla planifolia TaxID=51239 RepID=A0A835U7N4_VANPL|nr:hypothetical protein HPP92_026252 [Vanilla planifolia]